jgi:hypothetical protein
MFQMVVVKYQFCCPFYFSKQYIVSLFSLIFDPHFLRQRPHLFFFLNSTMTQDDTRLAPISLGQLRSDSVEQTEMFRPFIIGIAGGPACGKVGELNNLFAAILKIYLLENRKRYGTPAVAQRRKMQ